MLEALSQGVEVMARSGDVDDLTDLGNLVHMHNTGYPPRGCWMYRIYPSVGRLWHREVLELVFWILVPQATSPGYKCKKV